MLGKILESFSLLQWVQRRILNFISPCLAQKEEECTRYRILSQMSSWNTSPRSLSQSVLMEDREWLYSEKILPYIYGMKPLSLITGSKNVSCCISCGLRGNWEFQLEQSYGSVSIGKNYFFKGKYICQLLKWGKGSNNVHITEGSDTSLHPCRESRAHQWWGEWMVLFNRDMKQGRRNSKTSRFWE